jgi:hypothetical protein
VNSGPGASLARALPLEPHTPPFFCFTYFQIRPYVFFTLDHNPLDLYLPSRVTALAQVVYKEKLSHINCERDVKVVRIKTESLVSTFTTTEQVKSGGYEGRIFCLFVFSATRV